MSVAVTAKQATITHAARFPVLAVPSGKNVPFFVFSGLVMRNSQRPLYSCTVSSANATSSNTPRTKRAISIRILLCSSQAASVAVAAS